jgi:hypothetical protein
VRNREEEIIVRPHRQLPSIDDIIPRAFARVWIHTGAEFLRFFISSLTGMVGFWATVALNPNIATASTRAPS